MQLPGSMLQSVSRSAGLASHDDAALLSELECPLEPKFD